MIIELSFLARKEPEAQKLWDELIAIEKLTPIGEREVEVRDDQVTIWRQSVERSE